MPSELKPDDEVTDWQYQWQGPDGAETWWPAMPFVHAQIYLVTLFPAFVLGVLLAWGFGTGLCLVRPAGDRLSRHRPGSWSRSGSSTSTPPAPSPGTGRCCAASCAPRARPARGPPRWWRPAPRTCFDELATDADAGTDESSDERADEPSDEGRDEPPDESRDEPRDRPQAQPANRAAGTRDDDAEPDDETWSELTA